jgi:molybdate-binding protein
MPAVDVALRIAAALQRSVEELFAGSAAATPLATESVASQYAPESSALEHSVLEHSAAERAAEQRRRVALAHIAGRWLSYPLSGDGARLSADALALPEPEAVGRRARSAPAGSRAKAPASPRLAVARLAVAPMRPLEEVQGNLVLMGCALGLGLLADRLNASLGGRGRPAHGRCLWFTRSNGEALAALAKQQVHIAGVHLPEAKNGEPSLADVRRLAGSQALSVITLARWEAGLLVAPGNPKQLRSAADLGRRGLRCVVREAGSGARRLLERELSRAGLSRELASSALLQANGHLQVAQAVAMGAADVGVATRDAALAYGLCFVALAEERYDLLIPQQLLEDARVQRLLDTLSTAPYRQELAALGYDVRNCGQRVAELAAA